MPSVNAQANGMLVVIQCRKQNKEMQECLSKHYNEDEFVKFLERKVTQISRTSTWTVRITF